MAPRNSPHPDASAVMHRRLEQLRAEIAADRAAEDLPLQDDPDDWPALRQAGAPGGAPGRHARSTVGPAARGFAWVADRLPPTLQGRVGFGMTQLAVLGVTIGLGLALSAWWVLRADDGGALVPTSSPVAAQPLVTPAATPSLGADTAGPGDPTVAGGTVVVDVTGKVRRPGIATLPAGARVIDAVEAAGGLRRGVDRASINLARLLVDGEQIVVGVDPVPGVAAGAVAGPAPTDGGLVNLNTADLATLDELPGVGPVTATAIVAWREENGGFRAVDDLLEVSGIGEVTLSELAPLVTL